MKNYIIAYRDDGKPQDQGDRSKWEEWIKDLGDAVVNPGTPLMGSKLVSTEGVSDEMPHRLTGFTTVKAENIEAAIEMAKSCPYLEVGSLQVAEMMQM